jgi:hypothetical protein
MSKSAEKPEYTGRVISTSLAYRKDEPKFLTNRDYERTGGVSDILIQKRAIISNSVSFLALATHQTPEQDACVELLLR